MRVVYLAAGAGGMYCGSCLRDNRLAATLIAQGRDVHLWPMYTPLKVDEPVVGERRVRFGGINVFLQQFAGVFRVTPGVLDRMFDSTVLLNLAGRAASGTRAEKLGPLTVSVLAGEEGRQKKELAKLVSDLRTLKPDIVNLPNLMFLGQARSIRNELGCKVFCTLSGEDLFLDALPEPHRGRCFDLIRERSADVDAFIAVTHYFAEHCVAHFHLPSERMHVVPMGIHGNDYATTQPVPDEPFTIGYFARICPEKGLDRLADAFIALRRDGRNCRLRIGGYLGKLDRNYLADVLHKLHAAGVAHNVEHAGELDRAGKIKFLQSLHVLSVPTVYREAKGFYILEAMAAGAPVVQPAHGSFPELIEATGGGVCYDPEDTDALTATIAQLMDHRETRKAYADKGRQAVLNDFTAEKMADATWTLYESVPRDA
ncbi:MAG: glycosyltransferase family 4 protein [Phycisphaerales bacterium]|nr:glycosyltransferase family 4 protein [Phycisphaerales bacterium]